MYFLTAPLFHFSINIAKKRNPDTVELLTEMGKTRSRTEVGVWRFLADSEWSRSAFFVNLLESESRIKF